VVKHVPHDIEAVAADLSGMLGGEMCRLLVVALSLVVAALCLAADMHAIGSDSIVQVGHWKLL